MSPINCLKCGVAVEDGYNFCPRCGNSLTKDEIEGGVTKSVTLANLTPKQEPKVTESETLKTAISITTYKESYSSAVKITLIWNITLAIITLLLYSLKGSADQDTVAKSFVQGAIARPMVVLLIALVISSFTTKDRKIIKFNSSCQYIMIILSVGDFFRWVVILGS